MTDNNLNQWRRSAETVAREAGQILADGFGNVQNVELKGAIDLVTEFDRRAEELIVRRLTVRFPDHAVVGEEGSQIGATDAELRWFIDPIDGTTNFVHGIPIFGVSIALARGEQIVAGAIYDPERDELFSAAAGAGATMNGAAIRVSAAATLQDSLLATGFPYDVRTNPDNNLAQFENFILRARAVRRPGAAAIDLAWTACGRIDGFWELRLNPWDVAAGALIVQEAGGTVTDLTGGQRWLDPANIIASNGNIHAEMLHVLRNGASAPRPVG